MEYTTEQYREEMKLPYRGRSYVYVYIGIINKDVQRSAHITSSFSGDETYLYENSSDSYEGIVSTENDGSVTFAFQGTENNIAGLTLVFTTVPDAITVTNGTKTKSYSVVGANFSVDDGYEQCSYLKITPDSGMLSLKSVIFGIGLQFSGKQIINTSRNNVVSHISNELPIKRFTFTVDNRTHLFNKDNPFGYADYLQEEQVVEYTYLREMSDGSNYSIKGGKVFLKDWSSDSYQAQFTCVGRLDYMNGTFYKGQYNPNGISALSLAQFVLQDAGITEYSLDPALGRISIVNPIPVCTHKEALQYIANACRCVLYEDREGKICIISANRPSFIYDIAFTGETNYSVGSAIFEDNSMYNYADAEYQYTQADEQMLFLPEFDSYMEVGFVSADLADANGEFENTPSVDITFKSEYYMSKLTLNFAVVIPTSYTVTFKLDGAVVNTQTISSGITLSTECVYEGMIDEIYIEFHSAVTNQRIHLNNLMLLGKLQYEITKRDLKYTPVATSLERVSKLNVHTYTFTKTVDETTTTNINVTTTPNADGGETIDIGTNTTVSGKMVASIKANVGENLIILNEPHYGYSTTMGTIKESGAYYLVIESPLEDNIEVYANSFNITDNMYSINVHEKGVEKNSTNQLISSLTLAQQQAVWLKDYYDDDLEYDLTYRGDPILDADDLVYLENDFVDDNEIRIEEETLNTSTGMDFTCGLLARRTSYKLKEEKDDSAVVGKAIVGKAKVGVGV